MDPNTTLARMRELANALTNGDSRDGHAVSAGVELAELVESLDRWISAGGFLPSDWSAYRA